MFIYIYIYIYIYTNILFAERQIIKAYIYAMFYILLNSIEDDLYVPSDRQMQQELQQTWTIKSNFPGISYPSFRALIYCVWRGHNTLTDSVAYVKNISSFYAI